MAGSRIWMSSFIILNNRCKFYLADNYYWLAHKIKKADDNDVLTLTISSRFPFGKPPTINIKRKDICCLGHGIGYPKFDESSEKEE